MLEVGGVEAARRQHHDAALVAGDALGADLDQRLVQPLGVVVDGFDGAALGEEVRHRAQHHATALQHVGDAGGRAHVVLQHPELPLPVADQVGAGDVDVDAERRAEVHHPQVVGGRAEEHVGGDHPVGDAALLVVDVGEEGVEGADALRQPLLDRAPLRRGDDPRHDREREDALGAGLVLVDGEGDAAGQQLQLGAPLARLEVIARPRLQPRGVLRVGRARRAAWVQHLVRTVHLLVCGQEVGHQGVHACSITFPRQAGRTDAERGVAMRCAVGPLRPLPYRGRARTRHRGAVIAAEVRAGGQHQRGELAERCV